MKGGIGVACVEKQQVLETLTDEGVLINAMGSYAGLYVKEKEIFLFKNENYDHFVDFFNKDELFHLKGRDAVPYASNWRIEDMSEDEYDDIEVYAYRTTVSALNDRMNVFGITSDLASRVFEEVIAEKIAENTDYVGTKGFEDFRQKYLDENKYLESLTYEGWCSKVKQWLELKHTKRNFNPESVTDDPFAIFRYHDDSLLLRMIIDQLPQDDVIVLDLSDVYEGGWVTEKNPEILSATEEGYTKSTVPPIIITEGVFDVYAIESALSVLKPHLKGYVSFLDFGQNNEGGASAAVRLLKSLAAARVENRVLVLLDNDTAAHEEVMTLSKVKLPNHFDIMFYPAISLASNYPTVGPQGTVPMDVNGLACSIEMYLGEDALTDIDNNLRPVQWKSKMPRTGKYQGEVDRKGEIQKNYRQKVVLAKKNGIQPKQDWSGMSLVIDAMITKLSTLPFVKTW